MGSTWATQRKGWWSKKGKATTRKDVWFFGLQVFIGLQKWAISCPIPSRANPTDWQREVSSVDLEGVVF